jgi:hypothetical protein
MINCSTGAANRSPGTGQATAAKMLHAKLLEKYGIWIPCSPVEAVLVIGIALQAGCTTNSEFVYSTTADSLARQVIEAVHDGDVDWAVQHFDSRFDRQDIRQVLAEVHDEIRLYTLGTLRLVHAAAEPVNGQWRQILFYEGCISGDSQPPRLVDLICPQWLITELTLMGNAGSERVLALHSAVNDRPLATIHGFRENLQIPQMLWLLLACLCAGSVVAAVASVIRSSMQRRWLWVLLSLVGVSQGTMSWTTGSYDFDILSVHLLVVAVRIGGTYSPWLVSWSFPAGALIALEAVRRHRQTTAGSEATSGSAEGR